MFGWVEILASVYHNRTHAFSILSLALIPLAVPLAVLLAFRSDDLRLQLELQLQRQLLRQAR